jgi:hypothetical protein
MSLEEEGFRRPGRIRPVCWKLAECRAWTRGLARELWPLNGGHRGRASWAQRVFFVSDGIQDRKVMDLATVKGLVKLIFDGRHREFPVESPRGAIRWERDGGPPDPSVVPAIPR